MSPAKGHVTAGGAETRAQLIRTARRIVEEEGVPALKLRDIARQVGLSPMAPYRHFADGPRELLAVVAEEGHHDLLEHLRHLRFSDPRDRVVELALGYVAFGVKRPNLYRALFHEQLSEPLAFYDDWEKAGKLSATSARHYRALDAVKLEVFFLMVEVIAQAQAAGSIGDGNAQDFGLALAALVHGLVGEFIDEGLFRRASARSPWSPARQRMSRRVIELLVKGFGG